jgi:leucyl/phenylalanyl-tRNA--protein transferase
MLLRAYSTGYFPMDIDGEILWFNPNPRALIELDEFHVSRSLRRRLNKNPFQIRVNSDFEGVMRACADRETTWISEHFVEVYTALHQAGHAHSLECWQENRLVGGVYGVTLGGVFFGESMFSRVTDASKVALYHLVQRLKDRDFDFLEVQFLTAHLRRLGARAISRKAYLARLEKALQRDCRFVD